MPILIDKVRISNYRAINELEVSLNQLTLLVGANNSGKTTFLKALQLALGIDRRIISKEDFYDDGASDEPDSNHILIDVRVVPVNADGERISVFDENWAQIAFSGYINSDINGNNYFCFRTKGYSDLEKGYVVESVELKEWAEFKDWKNPANEAGKFTRPQSIPLFFIDAQRDINIDIKDRFSYLGKLTANPQIARDKIQDIENEINSLNERIIFESPVLNHLKTKLEELNKTVNSQGEGVKISPINKKLRDIGRGLNINFQDGKSQSFPLEYHGMGTRSWASLLTLKAYISWATALHEKTEPYFPILALEEPEAHLHPNAQRQLFGQLSMIEGQKIISTHSPFIAAQCDLPDLRHFYKDDNGIKIGRILLTEKIDRQIKLLIEAISKDSQNKDLKRTNYEIISELEKGKIGKLGNEEVRKIKREIMNTRGELLFAKAIVLFEGETEEQAFPIFAHEYFGVYPFELGFCLIGVHGKNYKAFLSVARFLNIPWYIFSDGEELTVKEVAAQVKNEFGEVSDSLFFIENHNDFEADLLEHGFEKQLISAINRIEGDNHFPEKYIAKLNGQPGKKGIREYGGVEGEKRALLDILSENKTKYCTQIAENIVAEKDKDGRCNLPPKVKQMFDKIKADFTL